MQSNTVAPTARSRRVVDAFTRTLHALMAVSFGLAYITAEMDGWRWVHATMGYTLGAAFLLRLVWGVLGPRRVSLRALGGRLKGMDQTLELIKHHDWKAFMKLLLALSMVTLLVCVLPVLVSGYATYFDWFGEWAEEIHESLANLMVLAACGHLGAVAILSWGQRDRQIRPMITGCVEDKGPDLVKHNLGAVAVVLLLLVAAYWSWQTHQYIVDPQFTQQPRWLHPEGGYEESQDD